MGWSDWIRDGGEVEPSLYAADFRRLGEQIDALLGAGCRVFHFDCGDGHFVPPVTIGPVVLRSIAPGIHAAGGVLDCHLMVDDPVHHLGEFADSGADSVTFHVEAAEDAAAVAAEARRRGLAVGLAFNPGTSPERAAEAARAAEADVVLCMSIHPGYSGQEFMPDALDRIAALARLVERPDPGRRRCRGGERRGGAGGGGLAARGGKRGLRRSRSRGRLPAARRCA